MIEPKLSCVVVSARGYNGDGIEILGCIYKLLSGIYDIVSCIYEILSVHFILSQKNVCVIFEFCGQNRGCKSV